MQASTASVMLHLSRPNIAGKPPINLAKIKKLPSFSVGDKQDVGEIDNYLKHFGFMPVSSGAPTTLSSNKIVVGKDTSTALKAFQQFFSLKVDGTFGPQTREAMSESRCGLPDLLQSADFSVAGPWDKRHLKYAFGALSRQPQITADVIKAAVRRALNTWASSGVDLTFEEVATTADPDFVIEWRPAQDPDHSMVGGIIAHADFPPPYSLHVDKPPLPLHFDDDEHRWVDGAVADGLDIETVALHELGHILGLYHSTDPGAVMYPTIGKNLKRRALQLDDKQGVRNLYPSWQFLGGLWSGKSPRSRYHTLFSNLYSALHRCSSRVCPRRTRAGRCFCSERQE